MAIALIYETHSTTIDNERGVAAGWLPGELSEAGRVQAKELGHRRRSTVEAVIASDLRRAVAAVVTAGFEWQPGWVFKLPAGWRVWRGPKPDLHDGGRDLSRPYRRR